MFLLYPGNSETPKWFHAHSCTVPPHKSRQSAGGPCRCCLQGPNFARGARGKTAPSTQEAWGTDASGPPTALGGLEQAQTAGEVGRWRKRKVAGTRREVSISYLRGISKAAIQAPAYG